MSDPRFHPATFRTRTVRKKIAIMHPHVFASLQNQAKVDSTSDITAATFQGMPIQIRPDAPPDKVYIMDGQPEMRAIYEPPPVTFIDEERHTGPLEELHIRVESVCRLARA